MAIYSRVPTVRVLSRVLDYVCVVAAFGAAVARASLLARQGLFFWPEPRLSDIAGWPAHYVALLFASLIMWAVASNYKGIHKRNRSERMLQSYDRLWRTFLLWMGATTLAIFFLKLQTISREFTISFFAVTTALIMLREFGERVVLEYLQHSEEGRTAIVLGDRPERQLLAEILAQSHQHYRDVQQSDLKSLEPILYNGHPDNSHNGHPNDLQNGHPNGAPAVLDSATEAFVVAAGTEGAAIADVVSQLLKRRRLVHVVPVLVDTTLFRHTLSDVGGIPVITLEAGGLTPGEARLKRALDVVVAAGLLLALSPLMALIALLVRLTSSGPVMFSQERLGKDGARFRIHKFRSMRADAAMLLKTMPGLYKTYVDNNFKLPKDDFRVTRLGRFLRASSLDELPQLWNVLKGEMSLVGPRPVVPEEIERYGDYAALLLSVKPGMTGHWQTNGRSRVAEYSKRVRLDMEYVRDQSLRTDLEILVKTLSVVARMEGSH